MDHVIFAIYALSRFIWQYLSSISVLLSLGNFKLVWQGWDRTRYSAAFVHFFDCECDSALIGRMD